MKRKYRVILLAALVLGWMGVIFMFSSQDGAASSETSGRVVERVIAVVKPDKLSSEEISREEYDRWRYYYPKYDTTQLWAKVPSQELSDALVDAFKDHLQSDK